MIERVLPRDVGTPHPLLPALPPLVRYYDRFEDKHRSVRDLASSDEWRLRRDGRGFKIDFSVLSGWKKSFLKVVVADLIVRRSPATVENYAQALLNLPAELLDEVLETVCLKGPREFEDFWLANLRQRGQHNALLAIRYIGSTACRHAIGRWTSTDVRILRALPGPKADPYARVRSGECFLPIADQSKIVDELDRAASTAAHDGQLHHPISHLCVLALAFQYGLRPTQLALLRRQSVRLFPNGAVHVSVELIKQPSGAPMQMMVRSIQADWCILFQTLLRADPQSEVHLFGATPSRIGNIVANLTEEITGVRYTCGDLRHTGAQRLVDAGASRETVTEFLGHTNATTVDVYYASSPAQAELVNAALGRSRIYRGVRAIAYERVVSPEEVSGAPFDQQITGVPHGIPITGVGLCGVGQSLCSRSPVLACYTCHRFMPAADLAVHRSVLADMRSVVMGFDRPTALERVSPAMMQLRTTLGAVQELVSTLSGEVHLDASPV